MKHASSLAGALALLLAAGCQRADDVQPSQRLNPNGYDELALANGHWEWENATRGLRGNFTPATTGYTRQLVFGAGGQLTVYRGSQPEYRTTYRLSMGRSNYCNVPGTSVSLPLITYVSEPGLPNDDVKIYRITQSSNGEQLLSLAGESACVDGGAYETYRWVRQ